MKIVSLNKYPKIKILVTTIATYAIAREILLPLELISGFFAVICFFVLLHFFIQNRKKKIVKIGSDSHLLISFFAFLVFISFYLENRLGNKEIKRTSLSNIFISAEEKLKLALGGEAALKSHMNGLKDIEKKLLQKIRTDGNENSEKLTIILNDAELSFPLENTVRYETSKIAGKICYSFLLTVENQLNNRQKWAASYKNKFTLLESIIRRGKLIQPFCFPDVDWSMFSFDDVYSLESQLPLNWIKEQKNKIKPLERLFFEHNSDSSIYLSDSKGETLGILTKATLSPIMNAVDCADYTMRYLSNFNEVIPLRFNRENADVLKIFLIEASEKPIDMMIKMDSENVNIELDMGLNKLGNRICFLKLTGKKIESQILRL